MRKGSRRWTDGVCSLLLGIPAQDQRTKPPWPPLAVFPGTCGSCCIFSKTSRTIQTVLGRHTPPRSAVEGTVGSPAWWEATVEGKKRHIKTCLPASALARPLSLFTPTRKAALPWLGRRSAVSLADGKAGPVSSAPHATTHAPASDLCSFSETTDRTENSQHFLSYAYGN